MKIGFDRSFEKDFEKLPKEIKSMIKKSISSVIENQNISEIHTLKKLIGYKKFYRLKIKNYRIGIYLETDNRIIFSRVLHRKEIYRFFPKS